MYRRRFRWLTRGSGAALASFLFFFSLAYADGYAQEEDSFFQATSLFVSSTQLRSPGKARLGRSVQAHSELLLCPSVTRFPGRDGKAWPRFLFRPFPSVQQPRRYPSACFLSSSSKSMDLRHSVGEHEGEGGQDTEHLDKRGSYESEFSKPANCSSRLSFHTSL